MNETKEQIAFHGIKLHLNVHIYVSTRKTRRVCCLQNVLQMNYSCLVHAFNSPVKLCRSKLPREVCIKFLLLWLTSQNQQNPDNV